MAGKRLLDAAKIINAGRSIAKQHIVLRQQQWDTYNRTSSLTKVVKGQTDRVTVTISAGYELAKRFADETPSWQRSEDGLRDRRDGAIVKEQWRDDTILDNAGASKSNAQAGAVQPAASAIQDGSVPPAQGVLDHAAGVTDDGSLSSLRRRELQRQAERQIPEQTADTEALLKSDHGHDSFNTRSGHVFPQLSSLPRVKLPRHMEDVQGGDSHVPDSNMNQDVYYTSDQAHSGGDLRLEPKDDTEEVVDVNIFSNPKLSRMLGSKSSGMTTNPYANRQRVPPKPLPEMVRASEQAAAAEFSKAEPRLGQEAEKDEEIHDLAASISKEAQSPTEGETETGPSTQSDPQYELRESKVPSSRFGRFWQYGGLATSMAFGAVGEGFRRFTGSDASGSLMLSEANMNRLVAKLSRMRGAALKLGQMMSFQDSKMLPPAIHQVLLRVQDSADYMPASQRDKVLVQNLGDSWRDLFSSFDEKPFAAASIGQVHKATLASNGKDVAVKVQYPGVKNSIDSDLSNLSLLLTASRLLPKGLFLDKTIANARVELAWECDYEREADACARFQDILASEQDVFTVPTVYREASGPGVLTAEFMHGNGVTKIKDLSQRERNWLGTQILRLCLRELMEWKFMQTDPNWTNFLYNRKTEKLELLDFGASRDFPDKFVVPYVELLIAASHGDREKCRDFSIQLGYLTGGESMAMLQAHVDSVLTLAEPFVDSAPENYDFSGQTITDRVRANIGLMVRERLAPPPEETYSLHRKLSGAFLLCARLGSEVKAKEMFAKAVQVWEGHQRDALEKLKL